MDIYLFNWTNPEHINNHSIKPFFKQLGPYRFREFPDKHNITFHDNNSTVSYRKSSTYFFDPEGSVGTLEDVVSVVNILAIGAASKTEHWSSLKQSIVSLSLISQKINVVKKVREILFEGYHDVLASLGSIFSTESVIFDTVGFLVKKNVSDELTGKYKIHTGLGNISELGKIQMFNDLPEFPYREGECKKLKGSPGEYYPPQRSKSEPVYLFTPEMCRSMPYEYEKDVNIHGIIGNRYSLGNRAIDNGTLFPENKCYLWKDQPLASGVMNISICNFDQPIFISYPHFYMADPIYQNSIDGLSPQKDLHQSYMSLETFTSVTLEVAARLQTNVLLRPYGSISLFRDVPKILMPMFYVEQKFKMEEEDAAQLYYGLIIFKFSKYIGFLLIFLGIIFIALKQFKCARKSRNVDMNEEKDGREILPLVK